MKWYLPIIFFFTVISSIVGQDLNIKFYNEDLKDGSIIVYADNNEIFPVSVELKLELKGLRTAFKNGDITVLRANEKRQKIASLHPIPGKSWKLRTSARSCLGDVSVHEYDTNYFYELPFERGYSEIVSQGYLGQQSHQGEYALDFNMPIGTPVHAMRDGLVIRVVDSNNKSCPDYSCMQFNNVITIQHKDGTYADYAHLKQHSALVNVGDIVEKGMHIADSGNTGWTTGPHLHIAVFLPAFDKRKTIPTLFRISDNDSAFLQPGKIYRRT
ncbi:MAG: peptidoglycan DD-metalloendopeptidase family protein [Saprospiraceae bacterium]|nr:peptidoglycan DD-metalloendopeptidase family protein [Saprospiraceae bacterium]